MTKSAENTTQFVPIKPVNIELEAPRQTRFLFEYENRKAAGEEIDHAGSLSNGDKGVEVAMYRPGPEDYLSNAGRGAAAGMGLATAAAVIRAGISVGVGLLLSAAGKGGLIGALIGIGLTPFASLRVQGRV